MKVCLSFDDGRDDTFKYAFPIIKKHNLTASFHVTTGFIDGTYRGNDFSSLRRPVTIQNLLEMSNYGIEISSHGDKHITDCSDFKNSFFKLNNWGVVTNSCGFSVPSSNFTDDSLSDFVNCNAEVIKYVRVGRSKKCYSILNKINYFLYRFFKWQIPYNSFNKPNLIFDINKEKYHLSSLVVLNYTKAKTIIRFLKKHKDDNCLLIIMLHSILPSASSRWEWPTQEFDELCSYLSNEKQIICTTIEEVVSSYE